MNSPRHLSSRRAVKAAFWATLMAPIVAVPATASSEPSVSAPVPIPPPDASVFDGTAGGELLGTVGGPPVVSDAAPELPDIEAVCWLVADAGTGEVLAARNAHEQRPPASTIKLLTTLAALPEIESDATYVATNEAAGVEGSKVGIVPGETYALEHILHGMFLSSGNDAAYALGELAGGQDRVVELMNAKADELGAFDTDAVTPHGLDANGQMSSAYDLALLGRAALQDELIAELARTRTYDFPGMDDETFQIQNTNRLLGSYDDAIGLKNGYTSNAQHTVVGAARRAETTLIVVVMGTEDRAEDSAAPLLDWGFAAEDVEPVGVLVTPEDVRAAEAREPTGDDDAERETTPPPAGQDDSTATASQGPLTVNAAMIGGFVAAAALIMVIMMRRRSRRAGRYAASRR